MCIAHLNSKGDLNMKQNRSGLSVSFRLCAVLCACLVCALPVLPAARAESSYPPIEVVDIQPKQTEGPPAFVQYIM